MSNYSNNNRLIRVCNFRRQFAVATAGTNPIGCQALERCETQMSRLQNATGTLQAENMEKRDYCTGYHL